jgi:hypothetical protein
MLLLMEMSNMEKMMELLKMGSLAVGPKLGRLQMKRLSPVILKAEEILLQHNLENKHKFEEECFSHQYLSFVIDQQPSHQLTEVSKISQVSQSA